VLSETHIPRPVLTELRAIAGSENLRLADGELAVYARDATPLFRGTPDAVIAPADAEQVARILRLATDHGIPVIPRGAGSNLCAGTVPLTGGIVLSTARMNSILEVAPEEMLARAEPGVSTIALNDAAAAHGLFYPPDPGSRTVSTIGGNVATCAGGLRGLKYGVTRNYVLGLTVVLPTGEIVRTGGRLWKDVAGYDLTRLITGSEGTLGVITEVTVALLPPAIDQPHRAGLLRLPDPGRSCRFRHPGCGGDPVHAGVSRPQLHGRGRAVRASGPACQSRRPAAVRRRRR
jgi:glycolate oxidase